MMIFALSRFPTMLQQILAWVDFHYVRTGGSSQQCGASRSDARTLKAGEVLWHGTSEILSCKRTANTHVIQMSQNMGRYVKANITLCTFLCLSLTSHTQIKWHTQTSKGFIQSYSNIVFRVRETSSLLTAAISITGCSNVAPASGSAWCYLILLNPAGATSNRGANSSSLSDSMPVASNQHSMQSKLIQQFNNVNISLGTLVDFPSDF